MTHGNSPRNNFARKNGKLFCGRMVNYYNLKACFKSAPLANHTAAISYGSILSTDGKWINRPYALENASSNLMCKHLAMKRNENLVYHAMISDSLKKIIKTMNLVRAIPADIRTDMTHFSISLHVFNMLVERKKKTQTQVLSTGKIAHFY